MPLLAIGVDLSIVMLAAMDYWLCLCMSACVSVCSRDQVSVAVVRVGQAYIFASL